MRVMRAAALAVLIVSTFFSFEAKAALIQVVVAPARTGVHQAIDIDDPLSQLAFSSYRIRCHRPGRLARLSQSQPAPEQSAGLESPRPLPAPPPFRRRSLLVRAVARPGFFRRPDAERAPPA